MRNISFALTTEQIRNRTKTARATLIEKMRKQSVAIYIAVEQSVADDIAGTLRQAADLLADSGWRDISVYPKDAEYRLLYSSAHGQVVGAHVTGDVWHLVGVGAITDASSRPTHWMPLPAPPGGTR